MSRWIFKRPQKVVSRHSYYQVIKNYTTRDGFTLIAVKLSGSLKERHCDGSLISVSFQILDFSNDSSAIRGFKSTTLRLSLFCRVKTKKDWIIVDHDFFHVKINFTRLVHVCKFLPKANRLRLRERTNHSNQRSYRCRHSPITNGCSNSCIVRAKCSDIWHLLNKLGS